VTTETLTDEQLIDYLDDADARDRANGHHPNAPGSDDEPPPRGEKAETAADRSRYLPPLEEFLGAEEPDDDDTDDWIVRGLIAASAPGFVAGFPKSQKTLTLQDMAIAAASGAPDWCGCAIPRRTRVAMFLLEDADRTTRIRMWQFARGHGIDDPRDLAEWLRIDTGPIYFDDDAHVSKLRRTLDEWRPGIIVLDSLSRIHRADENSKRDMGPILAHWADIARTYQAGVVAIHHLNGKGAAGDNRTIGHKLRGTSDLFALARHVVGVELDRESKLVTISTDGNLPYQPEPFAIELVTRELPNGRQAMRFEHRGDAQAANDAALEAALIKVIDAATAEGSGISTRGIRDEVKADNQAVSRALRRLEGRGAILRGGDKHGGHKTWICPPGGGQ
jgi:hypothetical protein